MANRYRSSPYTLAKSDQTYLKALQPHQHCRSTRQMKTGANPFIRYQPIENLYSLFVWGGDEFNYGIAWGMIKAIEGLNTDSVLFLEEDFYLSESKEETKEENLLNLELNDSFSNPHNTNPAATENERLST